MPTTTLRPALRHDALFYDSDEALKSSAVSFVRGALECDEVVIMHAGSNPVIHRLRSLFAPEDAVCFTDRGDGHPVSIIDDYQRVMERGLASGVRGFRAIGCADLGAESRSWLEWLRYEAALNRVFADYPLHAVCPYDSRTVDPAMLWAIRRAHPCMFGPDRIEANEGYVDPVDLVTLPEHRLDVDPLQLVPPQLELDSVVDLRSLRVDLYPPTMLTALTREKVDDFVKAAGEVAINAWTHGRGPVSLRLWTNPHKIVCTVTDHGHGFSDPFAGYARSHSPEVGLGLWAARQLCDTLDYELGAEGFTVRLIVAD